MKIGIIGLGDIAQKAYLPVITKRPDVELILCTRNTATLSSLSAQYRITETCTDYKQLLGMGIDAVMIHAATSVHPNIADFFLRHNIAAFVDKPLADNAHDCERLYDTAEQFQQPLYIGFNRRHIPLYSQHLKSIQTGNLDDLRVLRWEKNRFDLPGDVRTFIFDDFIHALDSINITAKNNLDDVTLSHHSEQGQLTRIDVQWQANCTLYQASMNRQFGITRERCSAAFRNEAFEFDSFVSGRKWRNGEEHVIGLKDWTPMLDSKGFAAMIDDWINVIKVGKLDPQVMQRNLASHQLAEAILQKL